MNPVALELNQFNKRWPQIAKQMFTISTINPRRYLWSSLKVHVKYKITSSLNLNSSHNSKNYKQVLYWFSDCFMNLKENFKARPISFPHDIHTTFDISFSPAGKFLYQIQQYTHFDGISSSQKQISQVTIWNFWTRYNNFILKLSKWILTGSL